MLPASASVLLSFDIPGSGPLQLEYLVLDVNGTLTDRGILIEGVEEPLRRLRDALEVRLLSADTFGNLDAIAKKLGLRADRISRGEEKRSYLEGLGSDRCAPIGNGANDAAMLSVARLGIAVVGAEALARRLCVRRTSSAGPSSTPLASY
jgi:P-type E1-E2 ATPase